VLSSVLQATTVNTTVLVFLLLTRSKLTRVDRDGIFPCLC